MELWLDILHVTFPRIRHPGRSAFVLPGLPLFPSTQRHTSTPPTFDEMEGMVSLSVIRGIMIETETPISSLRIQLQP
jgi:hypothetical protein